MMSLITVQHSVINRFGKITQHGLFRGIVRNLHHYPFVFRDFISDGIGIVHQIFIGEVIGNKQLVQAADNL